MKRRTKLTQAKHQNGKNEKQFNKDTTLERHMKIEHKNSTRMEGQGSSQKLEATRNEVQGQVKN